MFRPLVFEQLPEETEEEWKARADRVNAELEKQWNNAGNLPSWLGKPPSPLPPSGKP